MSALPTTATGHGYSFLDVETMGGDELRSLTLVQIAGLMEEGIEVIAKVEASAEGRNARGAARVRRYIAEHHRAMGRLHYYIGAAAGLEELMTERGYSGE